MDAALGRAEAEELGTRTLAGIMPAKAGLGLDGLAIASGP